MLIRPHDDASDDDPRWRAFVRAQGFGHLVAAGRSRVVPVVVPTQFTLVDDTIVLHLAVPNPIFPALVENPIVVLSVAGDWSYVPGAWKAIGDEDPAQGIPTTLYAAVQLTGEATVHADPEAIAAVLRTQLGDLEPDGGLVDPAAHHRRLRAIRGIEVAITEVRAKFKYAGNLDDDHRAAIARRLVERDGPGDAAALAHLRGR